MRRAHGPDSLIGTALSPCGRLSALRGDGALP